MGGTSTAYRSTRGRVMAWPRVESWPDTRDGVGSDRKSVRWKEVPLRCDKVGAQTVVFTVVGGVGQPDVLASPLERCLYVVELDDLP